MVPAHGPLDPQRLQSLQRITDAALAYLPEEDLLQELLGRVAEIMAVDTVAILLLEGEALHARAAKGIEEEVEQGVRIPLGRGFAGRIAAERRAIAIEDVDHADILNPILREKGIRSLLGVPLLVEGAVIGVLHVGSLAPRVFTAEETALLQLAGDRAALAIEQARLFEKRRLAEELQRRLLPADSVDGPAGLEVASRYLPAAGGALGGDWYDVFEVLDGRIGVAVGDVVGHGVQAAAVMGQLRIALRAYAVEGHPPAIVVDRVNTMMASIGPRSMTTLGYLVLDPATETVEVVLAGHPPPLIIEPGGAARYLDVAAGLPLGASRSAVNTAATFELATGSIVALYTDGLVERRGESLDEGLERLRAAAAGFVDVEALCAAVVERMVDGDPADDIALIAARVPPLGDRLRIRRPADLGGLADTRHLLRRWLRGHGVTADEAYDIVVASQEACANAVEHAYGPGGEGFVLDAQLDDGVVRISVRDFGRWRATRSQGRGRGLAMMRGLMDDVDVRRGTAGSEVVLTRRLGRRG